MREEIQLGPLGDGIEAKNRLLVSDAFDRLERSKEFAEVVTTVITDSVASRAFPYYWAMQEEANRLGVHLHIITEEQGDQNEYTVVVTKDHMFDHNKFKNK
jgi:hypothetical protein